MKGSSCLRAISSASTEYALSQLWRQLLVLQGICLVAYGQPAALDCSSLIGTAVIAAVAVPAQKLGSARSWAGYLLVVVGRDRNTTVQILWQKQENGMAHKLARKRRSKGSMSATHAVQLHCE